MADDQFAARENNYMDTIGGRVAGIVVPLAEAHMQMQRAYARDVAKVLTEQVPVKVSVDRNGQRYELEIWMPLLLVTAVRPLDYDQGTGVSTRMEVSANKSDSTKVGSKVETGVQGGWGPVSASFKAEVTVDHNVQRDSHYASTVEIDVKLVSREPPEMVSKLANMVGDFVRGNITAMLRDIEAGEVEAIGPSPVVPALEDQSGEAVPATT